MNKDFKQENIDNIDKKPICFQDYVEELKRNWEEFIDSLNIIHIILMLIWCIVGIIALI